MDIHLVKNYQLTDQQIVDLEDLTHTCKIKDGHTLPVYAHLLRKFRPAFQNNLLYHHQKLIGFLTVFFFYEDACEVVLLIDPPHRKQGYARKLLQELFAELFIDKLIFSNPSGCNDAWLMTKGFSYKNSELEMQFHLNQKIPDFHFEGVLREALPQDIAHLSTIHKQCFEEQANKIEDRIALLFNDPDYKIMILEKEGIPIAKAHLWWQKKQYRLMDFGVLPEWRKQGFGAALLWKSLQYALIEKKHPLYLDVKEDNSEAIRLYHRFGFIVSNKVDYWIIQTQKLRHR